MEETILAHTNINKRPKQLNFFDDASQCHLGL